MDIMCLGLTGYHKPWTNIASYLVNSFTVPYYTLHMAICSPEISIPLFASSQADFISFPLKTALPETIPVVFLKSAGIMGRGEEKGAANGIKPCQVLQLSKQFKICAIFRSFLFLVNRKAVSLYFSEHK